jgi:hypothetical protein
VSYEISIEKYSIIYEKSEKSFFLAKFFFLKKVNATNFKELNGLIKKLRSGEFDIVAPYSKDIKPTAESFDQLDEIVDKVLAKLRNTK